MKKINDKDKECEITLYNNIIHKIPDSCKIKNFIANLEIWHKLRSDQWIFSISVPTQLSIICENKSPKTEIIQNIGTFEMKDKCKAFTTNIALSVDKYVSSQKLYSIIPLTDINEDDCCKKLKKNITMENIVLEPLKLSNLDLNELKYAESKLNEFDEQLKAQLNKPFIIKKSYWFTTILSIIVAIIVLIIAYNILKCFGIINLLKRLCCFSSETRKLKCLPCLNIYNQCNTKTNHKVEPFSVTYTNTVPIEDNNLYSDDESPTSSLRKIKRINKLKVQSS
ncbi:hypothetical protein WA026_018823 [Henosepilachna vigintioctopunctata]|uniref:Uncharacterized protein n=1 Tax=Henosepilachna vigintioctopunctata TaxID=420089 RepID=A0AAW1TPE7_9CUCU